LVSGYGDLRMLRDKFNIAMLVLSGAIIVAGIATFGYSHYFYGGADPIAKFLCEDFPVVTGKYDRCMTHYKQ
jgi:hypothetical protein